MAYEIDFIGVNKSACSSDADAICLRWRDGDGYKVGIVDGGFEAHGKAMVEHLNKYYFTGRKAEDNVIDFIVVTHADQDHVSGLKVVIDNFTVGKLYMNRPWKYAGELLPVVRDGRTTVNSLKDDLKKAYSSIAEIEELAISHGIEICDAFEGVCIESKLQIVSPSKGFYLQLLAESPKTSAEEQLKEKRIISKGFSRIKESILNVFEDFGIETLREGEKTSAENEMSVVLLGCFDDSSFLLTGDAGIRALGNAISYMGSESIDVRSGISFYQIPHHGSRHNVSPSLLDKLLGAKLQRDIALRCNRVAVASVAENSDHPRKMVTNAFIRRGVRVYKTNGGTICHSHGAMPDRDWGAVPEIGFSDYVESWDD